MLFLLLIMIVCICGLTLYVLQKTRSGSSFNEVLFCATACLMLHAAYALKARYFFDALPFVDRGAPFGLMYGPLLYLAAFSNDAGKLKKKNLLLHAFPFLLATVCYIVFLSETDFRNAHLSAYYAVLYGSKTISMFVYVLVIFFNQKKITNDLSLRNLVKSAAIWLILIASLFASIMISRVLERKDIGVMLPGVVIYGSMLLVSALIFKYSIGRLLAGAGTAAQNQENEKQNQQYKKSALTPAMLEEYEERLDKAMNDDLVFLDTELSLESLSKKVKIPKHHLTQLFNTKINRSFYQYINTFRITYSCQLLKEATEITLEEIAFQSGFNSKVSFNRYFKTQMNCTPSEYRQQYH